MKQLTILLCIIPSLSFCQSPKQETIQNWGYVHHIARLKASYLRKAIPHYSVICISGYSLSAQGKITHTSNRLAGHVKKITKQGHIKLYPLIIFKSVKEGKKLLTTPSARKNAVINIEKLIHKNKFKGIHLDFEYLPPSYTLFLEKFLQRLHHSLRKKNCVLSMAVFPQIDFPGKWSGFHNLKHIAPYLDQVVVMCYDYHRNGTSPGPVTGIDWAEKNIQHTMRFLKPSQVWLGIPAYGYKWITPQKAVAISSRFGKRLAKRYTGTRHKSGTVYLNYIKKGKKIHIYFSDKTTRRMLRRLAQKYKLKGTAVWRLGFED